MAKEIRIIVAGSRNFEDYQIAKWAIDEIVKEINKPFGSAIRFVSGKARGADALGEHYAMEHGYPVEPFPAKWDQYKQLAGRYRNAEMAAYAAEEGCCGYLIALWDGKSPGTKHMIETARKYGLEVHIVHVKE